MKKILALLLSFVFLTGNVLFVSATEDVLDAVEETEATTLLEYIGLFEEGEDLTEQVTRAEFADYIAKLINADSGSGARQYYADIEPDMWAAASINALTELGHFAVGENATFRPEDDLKTVEAIKVVMSVIGYRDLCEAKGGFPSGYLQIAERIDLTEQITEEFITKGKLAVLLYRAMLEPMYVPEMFTDDSVKYRVDKNSTLLSTFHRIYYLEDVVNAAGQISIYSDGAVAPGYVRIGKKVMNADEISKDMFDYLGVKVRAFYKVSDSNAASAVLVFPCQWYNKTKEISVRDVVSVNDKGGSFEFIYFDENNNKKQIKIPRGCIVVKNGENVTSNLYKELKIGKGSYKFLDNDDDGKYDVLFVKEYYNLVVGHIENQEGLSYIGFNGTFELYRGDIGSRRVIYDEFDKELSIDVTEDGDKIIKFKDAVGNLISLNDITVSEVLSVYQSKNGKYIEICRGKGTVKGTVSQVAYNDSTMNVFINENEYIMDKSAADKMKSKLKPGLTGTFYLDASGELGAYNVEADTQILFGYLIRAARKSGLASNEIQVKLFDQNGVLDVYQCAESIVLDGERTKNSDLIYGRLSAHCKEIIRFMADENKVISFVDTTDLTAAEGEIGIVQTSNFSSAFLCSAGGFFNTNNDSKNITEITKSTTPLFVVPTDEAIDSGSYEDRWFQVLKKSNLRGDTTYNNVSTYKVDKRKGFEDLIVMKSDGRIDTPVIYSPVLISQITQELDEDGTAVDVIIGYEKNKNPVKLMTANTNVLAGYNLKSGDLVWFDRDVTGRLISVIDVLVDNEETLNFKVARGTAAEPGQYYAKNATPGKGPDGLISSSLQGTMCVAYGYAAEMADGVIKFAYSKDDCAAGNYDFARNLSDRTILAYDENSGKNGRVYLTGANDIVDYRLGGNDCDTVVIYLRQNAVQCVYVYK